MMKKLFAIIVLVMVASLSIAGCTSSTNSNQKASSASQTASSAASTTTHTTTSASATRAPPHLKVLYFYEPNCPYCKALEPHVAQLQKTYAGKVPVQSIVNHNSPLSHEYEVPWVPTLILLNNGREVGQWVDATNTTGISAQINNLLRAS